MTENSVAIPLNDNSHLLNSCLKKPLECLHSSTSKLSCACAHTHCEKAAESMWLNAVGSGLNNNCSGI